MQKSEQKVRIAVSSSPADVWGVIGRVSGVNEWLAPMITACRVEGSKRYCSTEGGEFEENILKIDHENRVFKYNIPEQHMLPVSNIVGTMSVFDGEDGGAEVTWHWTFDVVSDEEAQQAREMLAHAGEMGINGIDALIKRGAAAEV